MIHLTKNPDKLEAKALTYEQKGKTAKAIKYREKAARLRGSQPGFGALTTPTSSIIRPGGVATTGGVLADRNHDGIPDVLQGGPARVPRTAATYEANALKWEQRGNWTKAQKNREKVWRLNNPTYATLPPPVFYRENRFLGYDVPFNQGGVAGLTPLAPTGGLGGGLLADRNHDGIPDVLQGGAPLLGAGGAGIYHGGVAGGVPLGGVPLGGAPLLGAGGAGIYHGGVPTATVTGTDLNRDGIPDQLQGGARVGLGGAPLLGVGGAGIYHGGVGGVPTATVTGTDLNRDGIPDQLQGGIRSGLPIGGAGLVGGGSLGGLPYAPGILPSRDAARIEARLLRAERKGNAAKAARLRQKLLLIRGGTYQGRGIPAIEAKALRFEQQGNWKRAQKERAKIWRLQNSQYISAPTVPTFYNNNTFLGYNVPYTPVAGFSGVSSITTGISTLNVASTTQQTVYAAPIVNQVVRPVIVTETARPERIVEVQPIIHREVEAPTVKVIEQHIYETVPSLGPNTITNTAIVQETVRPHITEEVQQIVHREVPAPFIERVEQHVTEHIVQPVVQTKEVVQDTTVRTVVGVQAGIVAGGVVGVGAGVPTATVSGVDLNRDGIPDQLQGGARLVGSGVGIGGGVGLGLGGGVGFGGVPTATVTGTDLNRDGIPDQLQGGIRAGVPTATISGTDLNRDGIPDQLQGGRRI